MYTTIYVLKYPVTLSQIPPITPLWDFVPCSLDQSQPTCWFHIKACKMNQSQVCVVEMINHQRAAKHLIIPYLRFLFVLFYFFSSRSRTVELGC